MSISLKNPNNFYHKIYYKTCNEFEKVRQLCLLENNWLKDLYTPKNLILENHHGYGVIFHKISNEPVGMGGIFNDGRYPNNVARHLHREYLFPKFRQKSIAGLIDVLLLYKTHLIEPLNSINKFDVYFLAMQNRDKKISKGYWKIFSEGIVQHVPNWKLGQGYIQTCPYNVQKCWQNFIYCDMVENSFLNWNPKIISHEEWLTLIPGN